MLCFSWENRITMTKTKSIKKSVVDPPRRGNKVSSKPGNDSKDSETIYWVYFLIFLVISLVLLYFFRY